MENNEWAREIWNLSSSVQPDISPSRVREIRYLQATMYYSFYHINTTALYQKEKSIY